jgi:hypothetical protein
MNGVSWWLYAVCVTDPRAFSKGVIGSSICWFLLHCSSFLRSSLLIRMQTQKLWHQGGSDCARYTRTDTKGVRANTASTLYPLLWADKDVRFPRVFERQSLWDERARELGWQFGSSCEWLGLWEWVTHGHTHCCFAASEMWQRFPVLCMARVLQWSQAECRTAILEAVKGTKWNPFYGYEST